MPPLLDRELEIKLDQLSPNLYRVELRFDDPDNDALGKPVSGKATFDFGALQKAFRNSDYGKLLTSALFAEPEIFAYFVTSKKGKEGSALRLRLFIDANAIELNSLRWELLEDPETGHMLTTSERIKFSRFVLTRDWRPIKLRAKSQLRALIAVSAPNNLSGGMAEVRKEIEIPAALKALSGIETIVLGQNEPVTLKALIAAIRTGVDIVYLVCHGSFPEEDKVARLWLQNEDGGTHKVMGKDLAQSFSDLIQPPRLMVLASCESGGSDGMFAHSALAPMLAENGVPAIIAMQAKISMRTVELAMPVFFSELLKDGQIDRAMAVARGSVRTELDAWVPALYLRLKSGSLWYQPGFGGTAKADDVSWDSVCIAAAKLELVPIIGPDLAEHILGTSTEFAAALAFDLKIAISPDEKPDSAKIAQTIHTKSDITVLREGAKRMASERLCRTALRLQVAAGLPEIPNLEKLGDPQLLNFIVDQLSKDPDDPFRILADLPIKVFVSGALDIILKRFLKKRKKFPVELFTDWRNECIVDTSRLIKVADALIAAFEESPDAPVARVFSTWKNSLDAEIPLSVQSAVDNVEEKLLDNPGVPAIETVRKWRETVHIQPSEMNKKPWSIETPVLYYVYGKARYENTWVLTEDDFFDFLIRHSTYKLLPTLVGEKLVAGSLLFLGFSLDDWKFRILFRIIMSRGGRELLKNYKHVGVQVDPEQYTPAEAARLKPLLVKYFGDAARISIYWGNSSDFLKELRDHMKDPKYQVRPQPVETIELQQGE